MDTDSNPNEPLPPDQSRVPPPPPNPPPLAQPPSPGARSWQRPAGEPHGPRDWQAEPRKKGGFLRLMFKVFGGVVLAVLAIIGLVSVLIGIGSGRQHGMLSMNDKIALLRIEGPIMTGPDYEFWMKSLREFAESTTLRGIVVRIDSPGGAVGASQEIYEALSELRNRHGKKVFVSMGDVAASGGYYIAAASERIFALKGTLTGSIGVIFSKPQIAELTRKLGVETEIVKSGRFKDSGSIQRPMTEEERSMFNYLIDNTYQQFLTDILDNRSMPLEKAAAGLAEAKWSAYQFSLPPNRSAEALLRQIADGRVYTGEQALELGLVDRLGTLDNAIEDLAGELGITGRPRVYEPTRKPSLRELLQTRVDALLPRGHASLQYLMTLP